MPAYRLVIPLLIAILVVTFPGNRAHADTVTAPADSPARIQFLQKRLDGRAKRADYWTYGWLIGFSAVAVAQGTLAIAVKGTTEDKKGFKVDQAIGAATAFLGAGGMVISPVPTSCGARELRGMPEGTAAERAAKLAKGESLLREASEGEIAQRDWTQHALNVLVGVGSGALLWVHWNRHLSGVIQTVSGVPVGEAMILTSPLKGRDGWHDYQAAFNGAPAAQRAPGTRWGLWVRPDGALGLAAQF